ncbi:MAG: hypothetical protein R2864_02165 [Syntrophotaleaceae bacterium]
MAARMALRILSGENAADIPILRESPNEFFDYHALKHFNIPRAALPPGSRILNSPPAFYPLTSSQLLVALLVMSAIALALLANIMLRRRAEKALRNRQARLKAIHDNCCRRHCPNRPRRSLYRRQWQMGGDVRLPCPGLSRQKLSRYHFCRRLGGKHPGLWSFWNAKSNTIGNRNASTRKDGSVFWVDFSVTPILNHQGQ